MGDREDVSLRVPSSSTRKNVAPAQSLSLLAAVLLVCSIAQTNWRRLVFSIHWGGIQADRR
jgi:hypothetical protein